MEDIKVLIVDDSALMRSLIGKIVDGTEGLTVAEKAMNGRFALQKLERVKPDIIVLDLEMPEMNGIEFLRERKKLNIDIPVIVLSSIAKEGARITMECLELGASDFVTKPSGSESANLASVAHRLIEFLQAYGRQYQMKKIAGSTTKTSSNLTQHYSSPLRRRLLQQLRRHRPAANRCKCGSPAKLKSSQSVFQPAGRMHYVKYLQIYRRICRSPLLSCSTCRRDLPMSLPIA